MHTNHTHRVVVVGGGFGGLRAVQGLRRAPVDVTLVDRHNFTLFQPLVYQVATGALARRDRLCRFGAPQRRRDARVVQAEVAGFDRPPRGAARASRTATPDEPSLRHAGRRGRVGYSYFGHDEWRAVAAELKSL